MLERAYRWRREIMRFGIWNVIYRFWANMHVYGWDNIPSDGPVVMMGNHINMLDPVIMISFFPDRDIVPLAKVEAFSQPFMRYFVRHWGAIPVNRGESDLSALKRVFETLNRNDIVMLYAEGHRSKTGLIEGQEGTAYIATKANALVVPVAIWGTNGFPFAWFKNFKLMDIHISFGKPFRFRSEDRKVRREQFRGMTDEAMYQIAALLPEQWRGIYGDMSKATTRFLDFNVAWMPPKHRLPVRAVRLPAPSFASSSGK